jgi:hypothetical protein
MPPLSQIVSVNISVQDTVPTQAGFGTPLLLDYNTVYGPELVRTYSSVDAMTDDGFDADSAAVKAAGAFFAQNPSVPFIKVGRRTSAPSMNFNLTFLTAIEDYTVDVAIAGPYGSTTNSVTVPITNAEAGDPSLVAAKVDAAIDDLNGAAGIPNITTDDTGPVLNISTIAPGETPTILFRMKNAQGVIQNPEIHFSQDNDSPNAGVLDDYNAVKAEDNDFYGVILTSQSPAEYDALAKPAGVEGDVRLMVATSGDTDILSGGGLGQDLANLNLNRTALLYHNQSFEYADAAWMGALFPTDPGSATWAFKTLVGISADILTDTQISQLQSTYSNYYVTFAGVDITQTGRASSDRFLDITRGIDWLTARIQERVFTVLANAAKVPFTDTGIAIIETELRAQLQDAIDQGVLADSPAPSVSVPLAANVPVADRANRILPDVSFTAQLAGAIQEVQIVGTVTV